MVSRWTGAFQIAAVYVGTIVGAGFATGKEIVEFFTRFGFYGFIGILIAGYIFIFTGSKMMILSSRAGAATFEEFNLFLFGKKLSSFVNVIFIMMLIGVTAVMISGSGAVFEEQLGFSKLAGVAVTIILASLVLMFGLKGLFAINSFVVPIMIFFSVLLCILTINNGHFAASFLTVPDQGLTFGAIISPLTYTAFNLALSQAVLVPVAFEIGDEKVIKHGAVLGGIFLTIILLSGHFALVTLPNLTTYEIPSAELMKTVASNLYWVFILVIYGEIFTSVIGNIFGLQRQIGAYVKIPGIVIIGGIFLLAFTAGKLKYGVLLGYLYPLFGYISMSFLLLIWIKRLNK
ncbi:GerAB/ArcD/ProY family transporter [Peribacillus sp. B-H-3]|jgi:uncharacterized membrane protein YkvI|uniref:YkvI family membrane protein n=1 Tax=Peribacillus sp. B-H-3 TaxID=3400420 RepID=UPI003B021C1B